MGRVTPDYLYRMRRRFLYSRGRRVRIPPGWRDRTRYPQDRGRPKTPSIVRFAQQDRCYSAQKPQIFFAPSKYPVRLPQIPGFMPDPEFPPWLARRRSACIFPPFCGNSRFLQSVLPPGVLPPWAASIFAERTRGEVPQEWMDSEALQRDRTCSNWIDPDGSRQPCHSASSPPGKRLV